MSGLIGDNELLTDQRSRNFAEQNVESGPTKRKVTQSLRLGRDRCNLELHYRQQLFQAAGGEDEAAGAGASGAGWAAAPNAPFHELMRAAAVPTYNHVFVPVGSLV
jgi:hypothetical protein